jgi:hypothetical protein
MNKVVFMKLKRDYMADCDNLNAATFQHKNHAT